MSDAEDRLARADIAHADRLDALAASCRAFAAQWTAEARRLADEAAALRLKVADRRRAANEGGSR